MLISSCANISTIAPGAIHPHVYSYLSCSLTSVFPRVSRNPLQTTSTSVYLFLCHNIALVEIISASIILNMEAVSFQNAAHSPPGSTSSLSVGIPRPAPLTSQIDVMRPLDLTEHIKLHDRSAFGGYSVVWLARLEMGGEVIDVSIVQE